MGEYVKRLRLVFSGAQGVGKTTLINELHQYYPEFAIQEEPIRNILRDKSKVNFADDTIQLAILNVQRNFLIDFDNVFADRGVLDSLSYTKVLSDCGKTNISPEVFDFIKKESEVLLRSCFVDKIIFVPIEFPLIDDNFRTMDDTQQRAVQETMESYIKEFGLEDKVMRVTGSIDNRIKTIKEYIDNNL